MQVKCENNKQRVKIKGKEDRKQEKENVKAKMNAKKK